jgi:hypothetical protein
LHREAWLNLDIDLDSAPLFSPVELAGTPRSSKRTILDSGTRAPDRVRT